MTTLRRLEDTVHETITYTLKQSEFLEALVEQTRELSTHTVIFPYFVGERLGLNPTDHKCLDIIIRGGKPITGKRVLLQTSSPASWTDWKKQDFLDERDTNDR